MTDDAVQTNTAVSPPVPLHPPRFNWNTVFRGDPERASYNACVGNNGEPDIYHYADGYAESVKLLINDLTEGRGMLDILIYPICFCMRHSVELAIKGQITDLVWLATVRQQPLGTDTQIENILGKHDIKNLWDFFVQGTLKTDRRYAAVITPLTPLIKCIADTDPTGQTFRYSYSTEAVKHLTDVSIINILVLQEQFGIIWNTLEALRELTELLSREYQTGTFTRRLSRNDLVNIAKRLPARSTWGESDFAEIKTAIKAEYEIGSKELTLACNLIQKTRDTARMIGIQVSIPGLSGDDFIQLNEIWKTGWDLSELESDLRDDIDGHREPRSAPVNMQESIQRERSAEKNLPHSLERFRQWGTPDKLAGLLTLLEAGMDCYCEIYDSRFARNQSYMMTVFDGTSEAYETQVLDIWRRSVGRKCYPALIIRKLRQAGFRQESSAVINNLFA
ncbi:TPA: hypothetical protein N3A44_000310 [Salmonella enterica subsp. salamae serovar 53:z4,z24:-]|nr:hypothetical protein [Salmonella enterica subsp. salamae]HCM1992736.1 hypothetical protein [Salmonella enterica subsp. salamae serovar 53:z4,z24:-]